MPTEPESLLFRRRAHAEAARYGSDPWVFVRELLQNARDAGATRVEIEVSRHGAHDRVTCRDDGCGMSYQHARRYLFALYASSKEEDREQAGKFGIGFWSVLRFEPSTITIRSRGASGDAWQVSLDGDLGKVEEAAADLEAGTEIVLERPAVDGCDLAVEVLAATRRYGRFVTRRDAPETPLPVTVDGRSANAELKLEAPSAVFRGKGFRGAVGLGEEPEVELFAQGLFVRSASSLQDLQAAGELTEDATTGDVLAEFPSLAPRVLIDSAELDLLLARSDARYDKHLRRILRTAEKQLGRLITRQLQALRPQPFYRLWLGALRDRLEPLLGWHLGLAGLAGLALGLAILWWLPSGWLEPAAGAGVTPSSQEAVRDEAPRAVGPQAAGEPVLQPGGRPGAPWSSVPRAAPGARADELAGSAAAGQPFHAYADLADRYRGPRPGGLGGDSSRLAMLYEPAGTTPFFAALIVDRLNGRDWTSSEASGGPYRGVRCRRDCVETRLLVAAGQSVLRLPVPTGHRLDPSSVRFDGRVVPVRETANGEALVQLLDASQGVVEYRTGPAPSPDPVGVPEPLFGAPDELVLAAAEIRRLPAAERVQRALDFVAERVVYDRSPAGRDRYRLARDPSGDSEAPGFVEAALAAGAGDCDVQSGVLVTLLRLAGIEARLALGYAGARGTVAPGLHAWVEVRDPDGGWSVADPSIGAAGTAGEGGALARLPADPAGIRVPSPTGAQQPLHPAVPGAVAALLLGAGAWTLRRRSAAGIMLLRLPAFGGTSAGADEHLAALLGGALRHPEAFAGLPAMFHGRFVPLLGRRAGISLARARRMARRGALFRSGNGSELARRAAARGVPVIDASTAEGRVLSLALGAIDVDHWSSLMERSSRSEMTRRIDRTLDELGAHFRLRETSGLAGPWVEVALEDLKLGRRQIVVDPAHLEYAPVRALGAENPEAAAFTLLDILLHRIELPASERARILAAFARKAVTAGSASSEDVMNQGADA